MKNFPKKSLVLLIAAALLLTITVSGTVAYLVAGTDSVINTFTPATVTTELHEEFKNDIKSSVTIENTGTIAVYVRAMVVGNWVDASGNIVAPWTGSVTLGEGWALGTDGFYYYQKSLAPNDTTSNLLGAQITNANTPADVGAVRLVVTVLHQSIQAQPTTAVEDAWGVTVGEDGNLTFSTN